MFECIAKFGPSWFQNRKQNLIISSNKKVIAIQTKVPLKFFVSKVFDLLEKVTEKMTQFLLLFYA